MNIGTVDDAKSKIKYLIKNKGSGIVIKQDNNPAKRVYPEVKYYINLITCSCYDPFLFEIACVFKKFIYSIGEDGKNDIDITKINKLIIPYDSNFRLAYKLSELLRIPFVLMRSSDDGRITVGEPWDGNISHDDEAIIIHDVLVSGDQIKKSIVKIINIYPTYEIKGIFCLINRREKHGKQDLEATDYKVFSLLDINDEEIERMQEDIQ
jgi:adenine/guanine phosphoribosyltransferase-like PRPP-binding protein